MTIEDNCSFFFLFFFFIFFFIFDFFFFPSQIPSRRSPGRESGPRPSPSESPILAKVIVESSNARSGPFLIPQPMKVSTSPLKFISTAYDSEWPTQTYFLIPSPLSN